MSCCAEENVLMSARNTHRNESVMVHEMGHSVMNLGFDASMNVRPSPC